MNRYILDTDKKHLRQQVDTNNRCSFSLGKVHHPSRLHARSPRGRASPSPCSARRVALSTPVQNASQPFHSSVLYHESQLREPDPTQRPCSCNAGEDPQPLPSGISFSSCLLHQQQEKPGTRQLLDLALSRAQVQNLILSLDSNTGEPSLQKGRGAAATAKLRMLSSSAHCNVKNQIIIPLLVV